MIIFKRRKLNKNKIFLTIINSYIHMTKQFSGKKTAMIPKNAQVGFQRDDG